jgi:hypothetical protein
MPLFVDAQTPSRTIDTGKAPAKTVVVGVLEFWHELDAGRLVKPELSFPLYPKYYQAEYADLHSERSYYSNLGEVWLLRVGTWVDRLR